MITNEEYLKYSTYIGKIVRHFKGNYYYIENIAMDSENVQVSQQWITTVGMPWEGEER